MNNCPLGDDFVYHFYLGCSIVCDHFDEDFHKSLRTHVAEMDFLETMDNEVSPEKQPKVSH